MSKPVVPVADRCRSLAIFLLSVALLSAVGWSAEAEEKAGPAEPAPAPVGIEDRARGPVAAVEVVGIGNPLTALGMVKVGQQRGLWMPRPTKDAHADSDQLNGIEDRKPIQDADKNSYEAKAYNYLVLHAHDVPADALAKIASRDLIYRDFWEEPKKHRGAAVHIEGRLRALMKMDAPKILWNDGIKTLYEAWIFPPDYGGNPYVVIFSELPAGAKLGQKLPGATVTCDAYFFKRYRYGDMKKQANDAPLFIGRSFSYLSGPPKEEEESPLSFASAWLPGCFAGIILLVGLIVGVNYWFKRGDRNVRSRILDSRTPEFAAPPPGGYPGEDPRQTALQAPPPPQEEPPPENGADDPEKLRKSFFPGQ